MRSAARGPLISEGNHTTPLFHALVAAKHTHTHTCLHSFQQVHVQTDAWAYKTENDKLEGAGSEMFSCHTSMEEVVVLVRMKTLQEDGWFLKNHHSIEVLCYRENNILKQYAKDLQHELKRC